MVTSTAAGTELRTDPALEVITVEVADVATLPSSGFTASIHRLHRALPSSSLRRARCRR
jgi:hypothetical protein